MNFGEFILNGVLYAKEMEEANRRMNITPSPYFIPLAVVLTFFLGIVAVYLYAAIRPRFGPGVKTAVCAGLILWFCVYFYTGLIYAFAGIWPMGFLTFALIWGLVEIPLGTVAGAFFYKEP